MCVRVSESVCMLNMCKRVRVCVHLNMGKSVRVRVHLNVCKVSSLCHCWFSHVSFTAGEADFMPNQNSRQNQ